MEMKRGVVHLKNEKIEYDLIRALKRLGCPLDLIAFRRQDDILADFVITDSVEVFGEIENEKVIKVSENRGEDGIFLYQGARAILNEIMSNTSGVSEKGSQMSQTISVVSEDSKVGSTSLSVSIATLISRIYGSRVLYVSLAAVNRGNFLLSSHIAESTCAFKRLLYMLYRNREVPLEFMTFDEGGVSYLPVPRFNSDVSDFTFKLAERLKYESAREGYEYIVYDIGNEIGRNRKMIAGNSDVLVFILNEKNGCAGEFPEKEELERLVEKASCRRSEKGLFFAATGAYRERDDIFFVPWCRALSRKSLDREYGTEIMRLVEAIVEG